MGRGAGFERCNLFDTYLPYRFEAVDRIDGDEVFSFSGKIELVGISETEGMLRQGFRQARQEKDGECVTGEIGIAEYMYKHRIWFLVRKIAFGRFIGDRWMPANPQEDKGTPKAVFLLLASLSIPENVGLVQRLACLFELEIVEERCAGHAGEGTRLSGLERSEMDLHDADALERDDGQVDG